MTDRITATQARALREAATPGPWRRPAATSTYVHAADCVVHSMLADGEREMRDSQPRWVADANLIAAAPDLCLAVEALEADLRWQDERHGTRAEQEANDPESWPAILRVQELPPAPKETF